jgi:hypothetical protein
MLQPLRFESERDKDPVIMEIEHLKLHSKSTKKNTNKNYFKDQLSKFSCNSNPGKLLEINAVNAFLGNKKR